MVEVEIKELKQLIFFKLNAKNLIWMCVSVLINMSGLFLASYFDLPVWLNNIGTIMTAIQLGPVAGLAVGALSGYATTLIGTTFSHTVISSMLIGIIVGFLFPRKNEKDKLSIVSLALFTGLIAALYTATLNVLFLKGYTGNSWGDALYHMLGRNINSVYFNAFSAEAFIDVPDKAVSMLIAVSVINFIELRHDKKGSKKKDKQKKEKKSKKTAGKAALILLSLGMILMQRGVVNAADYDSEYETVLYGNDDGIYSAEVNTVVQTHDGFLWAGTYSGLYLYDGVSFAKYDLDSRIANVMKLYEDSKGRLWIGTNDSGVFCFDDKTGEIDSYNTTNGLSADAIRAICEDDQGNIFIGTVKCVSKITPDGQLKTYSEWPDITYCEDLDCLEDGSVIGVTDVGTMFRIKDDTLISINKFDHEEAVFYRHLAYTGEYILVGSSSKVIDKYVILNDELVYEKTYQAGSLEYLNEIIDDPESKGCVCCFENGIGFFDEEKEEMVNLTSPGFDGAASDACVDAQGNIWFSSSKHGLLKISESLFYDLFKKAGIDAGVVNAAFMNGNELYLRLDTGVRVIDLKSGKEIKKDFKGIFDKVRVRHIMKDSKGNMWFSTQSEDGLVCIDNKGHIETYNELNGGLLGGRVRSTLELSDGRILVATNLGLSFIKNGKVESTLGTDEGLNNPYILSMLEREDGTILAASDGDGIYVIKNDRIIAHKGVSEGLSTAVVLRMVKCTGGYLYVTSNALYYDNGDTIKKLEHFPYTNNYDIQISEDKTCWITSSAGLFVIDEKILLEDGEYTPTLMDDSWGCTTTFTANSWNVRDGEDLYLCCTDGVRKLSMEKFDNLPMDYQIQLGSVTCGQDSVSVDENGSYIIPPSEERIQFFVAVNNYSLSNPLVRYYLEGSGDEGITCYQNEITPLSFTNLPGGSYKLHIEILDSMTGEVKKETVYNVEKETMMYEKLYFRIYLALIGGLMVAYVIWLFYAINQRTKSIIGLQKEVSTDPMTGLLNKAGAKKAFERVCREETGILMMIDLDSFKLVNDLYGHDMGDKILIRFAELVREALHKKDIAARLGGDEFAAFAIDTMDEEDVDKLSKFLNKEILKSAKSYMGYDMNIPLGASIGAVRVPANGQDYEDLLKLADKALYVVKQNGKHGYSLYQKKGKNDLDEHQNDDNDLKSIKKIIEERNEGKGAYLVNFDKFQTIYKFQSRNDRVEEISSGLIRLSIKCKDDSEVPEEVKDIFEDYLVTSLRKCDVISVYSGCYYILCVGYNADNYDDIAERLIFDWDRNEVYNNYVIEYETEKDV